MTDAWAIVVVSISLLAMGLAWVLMRIGELQREIRANAVNSEDRDERAREKYWKLYREHCESVQMLGKLARKMGYEWTTPGADWAQE